jgi:UV DNA damage endonuclease
MRLGFSVHIVGRSDLPAHYSSVDEYDPDLSLNLACLRDILYYLRANDIHMYRLHSRLAPLPPGFDQRGALALVRQYDLELQAIGSLVREQDVRLSFHPYSDIVLNALNEDLVLRSVVRLEAQAAMLDALCLGPEAVIVLHVGGVYDDLRTSRERFVRCYEQLPATMRRRLVLENDDHRFSHAQVRAIHERCGIPLVLDTLHHLVHNPEGVPLREALAFSLQSWPVGVEPKVHFSTARSEMRVLAGSTRIKVPTWTEHSDFANPFEFAALMTLAEGLPSFDVLLESKARDLALLKLRRDLQRFAPTLAQRVR